MEGSPLVRLGWASQLFDTPIRVSGAASLETERFVNAPGAAIDYIRTSARAQYINPENDQDYSPFLSYVPRLDFDPTFANNFATRQDLNLGIDKVFNFDGDFNRVPFSGSSSGTWAVQGTRVPGSRRCREWLVHLTSSRGQLFGETAKDRNVFRGNDLEDIPRVTGGFVELLVKLNNEVKKARGSPSGATHSAMSFTNTRPASTVVSRSSEPTRFASGASILLPF